MSVHLHMTDAGQPPRTNRRGHATRENMLDAALKALATGDPGAASANRIAKDDRRHLGRGQVPVRRHRRTVGRRAAPHRRAPGRRALAAHADTRRRRCANASPPSSTLLYDGLTRTDSRAIETLRAALPRDGAELERLYPQTAAELQSWGRSWIEACQNAFADVDVDPERVREVATFIPGAMRGIASERQLGSLLRPRPGAARPDQRDRRVPRGVRIESRGGLTGCASVGWHARTGGHSPDTDSGHGLRPH